MLAREVPISRFSLKSSPGFYMFEQMQTCEMLKLCFAGVLWALSPETAVLVQRLLYTAALRRLHFYLLTQIVRECE